MIRGRKNVLMEKIENHIRRIARQSVKFDTLVETLDYLTESFWNKFSCDYVSIILKEDNLLKIKMEKGDCHIFNMYFPLSQESCSDFFFTNGVAHFTNIHQDDECKFHDILLDEGFANWMTVPIKESDSEPIGICVIAYRDHVPFVNDQRAEKVFLEFGKDIATSIELAIHKENELKNIQGVNWIQESIFLGSSIEQLIRNFTERAGRETNAQHAYVYLFDEKRNLFMFQPPSFGELTMPDKIYLGANQDISDYFPSIEMEGEHELTIPLLIHLKLVGVLHVIKKEETFTSAQKEHLQFLSSHISVLIENARMYKKEIEEKKRLETILILNQEMVQQTIVGEDFLTITHSLSTTINRTVILYDRFFRPISYHLKEEMDVRALADYFIEIKQDIIESKEREQRFEWDHFGQYTIWKIVTGNEILGFLVVQMDNKEADMFIQMAINQSINVYAIQFIKQKISLDANEQIKENCMNQLLVEKIEDKETLFQYASLFNMNLGEPHKIGLITIENRKTSQSQEDLLALERNKSIMWERIREHIRQSYPRMFLTKKGNNYVLFVPEEIEQNRDEFWEHLYKLIIKIISKHSNEISLYIGISQKTEKLADYYMCYRQALQALKIVSQRYQEKGYMNFKSLGSYTVLHELQHQIQSHLFVKEYLFPLIENEKGDATDLLNTLYVYLMKNGNLKDTADALHIHRNTLKYRIKKIKELINLNLDDAEERFNLILAYKLYHMNKVDSKL